MSMPTRSRRRQLQTTVLALAWLGAAASSSADAPPDRYTTNSSQSLVTDVRTGLVWQEPPAAATYTWEQAQAYCRNLSIGGMRGFRLPTLKELLTLVDPVRVRPAIDLRAFPNTSLDWFWTSSNRHSAGPAAVSFETGASSYFAATDGLRARCVR